MSGKTVVAESFGDGVREREKWSIGVGCRVLGLWGWV